MCSSDLRRSFKVPQLSAGHDLLKDLRRPKLVGRQQIVQSGLIPNAWLFDHGVIPQLLDPAAYEDDSLIHRICKGRAGVAANDDTALLHHEAGHVAAAAAD